MKPALTDLAKQYFKSVLSGKTQLALCSSLSIKISASVFSLSPYTLIIRLSYRIIVLIFTLWFSPSHSLPPSPLIPPSSFLKATCSQPVWLSCTLPMKGFLLGWDWVQPSRAWLVLRPASQSPQPPPSPTAQPTPHACSGLALSPRRRLLVSAALNCRQQLKRARERDTVERGEGTVLACWAVTWQAWTQRFVFLLSNPGSVLVGFIKMDVVFIKCW